MRASALIALLTLAAPVAAGAEPLGTVAFFGLHLLDESLQTQTNGADPEETARLHRLEQTVRDRFETGGYTLVDIGPIQEQLDRVVNPAKCYGCDTRMAATLGADYALVGEVQKVSNLILTMNLQLRDAKTGETVKGRVVDIRANTDEAWQRGMRYILKTAFFNGEEQ